VVPGIIFAFRPLHCQDPFWHVKAGEAMVRTHQVLKHDVFSHTAPGAHWTSLEWLSEVAMYCIHGALGFKGLRLMSALGFGAILVGVYRLLLRASGNKWWALIGTMIPYHFFLARMTGRPEVLGTVGLGSMHRV